MIADTGRSLADLASELTAYPQVLVNVRVAAKRRFETVPEIAAAVASMRGALGDEGRLVLRYSGTENIARVMVEGSDTARIRTMAQDLAGLIRAHLGDGPM